MLSFSGAFGVLAVARHAEIMIGRALPPSELWPLAPGAVERVERLLAAGTITDAEARDLEQFRTGGYVIFPGAIEPDLVDALVRDVRSIGNFPGRFVTTDHRNGRAQRLSGADFDSYESIFDTYVNFESARHVCFHPKLLRFIGLVFDSPVVAAQQLLFQRSNQHPVHQDTSVVCMEDPLLMVATWVALEDVVRGRGELTFYAGSHRIEPYVFPDGSRRLIPERDDAEKVKAHLLSECARLHCEKHDFIAKKGDVFLWAADLVHASNPRTLPEEETRLSVVTHYCPKSTKPYWFRFHKENRKLQSFEGRAEYASVYYRLPASGMATPNAALPT
ncbi:MAG TPA: phytanoyl-CoA dioxygenase family protein [Polyangiaceae bacterium]|nr:phytanoyl-CoA dioxygenase family protein [Polyangiaceae bacterium]